MSFKRIWAIFKARNHEFFRDREAFGWNFLFPFLLVAGFGIIFGGENNPEYKIGIFPCPTEQVDIRSIDLPENLKNLRYLEFIGFEDETVGLKKLKRHKIDFLIEIGSPPYRYWVSDENPKGYFLEKIFQFAITPRSNQDLSEKQEIKGIKTRYLDWFFPGILTMNMMFSALWGVGYIVVRYRKNGVLKRLQATPLTAFEYLSAQLLSRLFLQMFTVFVVWAGCDFIFRFTVVGSYFDIGIVFLIGNLTLCSLGLLLASRGVSEEFVSGIINFVTWPMMFLSEVWFSLEGAPHWVKTISKTLPLTHMLEAVRKIMNEGATLADLGFEISFLGIAAVVFLITAASIFSWTK